MLVFIIIIIIVLYLFIGGERICGGGGWEGLWRAYSAEETLGEMDCERSWLRGLVLSIFLGAACACLFLCLPACRRGKPIVVCGVCGAFVCVCMER